MTNWRSTTSVNLPPSPRWLQLSVVAVLHIAISNSSDFGISTSRAATITDLRDGARTAFYGGGFGEGSQVGDFYGWAMAFGDIDGDGFTDFLSSSANAEGPNDEQGHEYDVYLVFGGPHAELDSVYAVDAGEADIVFYKGGFSMACADIDRDGYDDAILAEAPYSVDPAQGGIYIIFGAPRSQLRTVYNFKPDRPDYTPPDVLITGSTKLGGGVINLQNLQYDFIARSLVSGDVNADGFADIIFGNHTVCYMPETCVDGGAYIVFGRPRNQFPTVFDVDYSTPLPHPDVLILGDSNERYATNLAIGDLDGDGVDDVLTSTTGGWGENNTDPGIGEIHGWWGNRDWRPTYDTQIDDFDFSLQGTPGVSGVSGYTAGYRMATGDFDGDGRDDLIIGSHSGHGATIPPDRRNGGEYRVFFGRQRALWPKWGNAVDMTDVLILGAENGDAFVQTALLWGICFSIATGNRDGDGYDDLLIGAGFVRRPDDEGAPGGAYWIRGRPRGAWEPFIDLRDEYDMVVRGVDELGSPGYQFDLLGFMTGMGDLDGNGKDEMFIAAPFADGPNNSIPDCGEIYVIYDSDAGTPTSGPTRPPLARASLLSNYPNPFNASTTLRLQAPRSSSVSLTIYDALGREVARPLVGATMAGDEMEFVWNAVDERGRALPSGVYFVKLRAANESHSRKVLLVR